MVSMCQGAQGADKKREARSEKREARSEKREYGAKSKKAIPSVQEWHRQR